MMRNVQPQFLRVLPLVLAAILAGEVTVSASSKQTQKGDKCAPETARADSGAKNASLKQQPAPAASQPATTKSAPPQSENNQAALQQILQKMNETARDFRSTQADFEWKTYTSVVNDFSETQTGKIYFRRRHNDIEMAADILQPAPKQVIFSDGKIQIYTPKTREVDVYDASAHKDEFEAFLVLGFGSSGDEVRKSFDVNYAGREKVGNIETVKLDLIPIAAKVKEQFPRIDLWIDPQKGLSLRQQLFQGPDGDYRLAEYSNFEVNQKISDKVFTLRTSGSTKTISH